MTMSLCRHYKCHGNERLKTEEESLQATPENRHRRCRRDVLWQTDQCQGNVWEFYFGVFVGTLSVESISY